MKTFLLVLLMIASAARIHAQEVVASSGSSGSVNGLIVDWTLGEPVIETFSGSNNTLTQGMHQPNLLVTGLQDMMISDLEVNVYPNPTSDFIIIEMIQQGNEFFFYEISDVTGSKMVLKKMQSNREEIDMSNYASGIYLLRLFTQNTAYTKVCNIIKK